MSILDKIGGRRHVFIMIVVMATGATQKQQDAVTKEVERLGFRAHPIIGEDRNVIACIGHEKGKVDLMDIQAFEGVEAVVPISKPYKLVSSETQKDRTVIKISDAVSVGGDTICVIAGPCSVESREQLLETAQVVKKAGAHVLRGGAFKPRTSPYDFQGLEEEGLKILAEARETTGLPVITEVLTPHDVELVEKYTDIMQVGARNVQNYSLLKELGHCSKPIFLKRGMSTTVREWLLSAEYIITGGNPNVMLCERGIRTFETATRNTLDLNVVPVLKHETHLPVVVDSAHGTGYWQYVTPMALAGIAAGADALMVEVHPHPEVALSDGGQSLTPKRFGELMRRLKPVVEAVGRKL